MGEDSGRIRITNLGDMIEAKQIAQSHQITQDSTIFITAGLKTIRIYDMKNQLQLGSIEIDLNRFIYYIQSKRCIVSCTERGQIRLIMLERKQTKDVKTILPSRPKVRIMSRRDLILESHNEIYIIPIRDNIRFDTSSQTKIRVKGRILDITQKSYAVHDQDTILIQSFENINLIALLNAQGYCIVKAIIVNEDRHLLLFTTTLDLYIYPIVWERLPTTKANKTASKHCFHNFSSKAFHSYNIQILEYLVKFWLVNFDGSIHFMVYEEGICVSLCR